MRHLLIAVILFAVAPVRAAVTGADLLVADLRPSVGEVMALMKRAETDPESKAFLDELQKYRSAKQADLIRQKAPGIIAAFEWSYPGAQYLSLGRDAALLGDILDGFYRGLSQERVERINGSTATFKDQSDKRIMGFLESSTSLDLAKIHDGPGWVIFDQTFWSPTSQSRRLLETIFRTCLEIPRKCAPEDFVSKFGIINTGSERKDIAMYRDNVVGSASFGLAGFFADERLLADEKLAPLDILSIPADPGLIYTEAYHESFSEIQSTWNGYTTKPGNAAPIETRKKILAEIVQVIEVTQSPEFLRSVEGAARKLRYVFPRSRVTTSREIERIRGFAVEKLPLAEGSPIFLEEQLDNMNRLKLTTKSVDASIGVMKLYLPLLKEPRNKARAKDLIRLLEPGFSNPSDAYKKAISELWNTPEIQSIFMALNPTLDDLTKVKKTTNRIDTNVSFMQAYALQTTSAKDFLAALEPGVSNPHAQYTASIQQLWGREDIVQKFASLHPTSSDLTELKGKFKTAEGIIALNRVLISHARTVRELIDAIAPGVPNPTDAYRHMIDALLAEPGTLKRLVNLKPTLDEMKEVKKGTKGIPTSIAVMRAFLPLAKSADEFLEIMSPGIANPNDQFLSAIDEEWRRPEVLRAFAALNPTPHEIARAKKVTKSVTTAIALIETGIQVAKDADAFVKMMEPSVPNPTDAYGREIQKLWSRADVIARFVKLRPTEQDLGSLSKARFLPDSIREQITVVARAAQENVPAVSTPAAGGDSARPSLFRRCMLAVKGKLGS